MDDEDGRDAEGELAVLGFVAEEIHAQEGADAAAGNGQPDEGVFRDAPLPFPGLPFVDAINQEGQDIDADEVDDEVFHNWVADNFASRFSVLCVYVSAVPPAPERIYSSRLIR